MFGLFKKSVSPHDFGQGATHFAHDPISSDALRSLGWRSDDPDASRGWIPYLTGKGVSVPVQTLYLFLYSHSVMQAAFTRFDEGTRRAMTQGAMSLYTKKPQSYDFEKTYRAVEAVNSGTPMFDLRIAALTNDAAQVHFLPNSNVAVLTAKYLIAAFVVPCMPNHQNFFDDFRGYSSTVGSSIGTACRAIDQLSKSVKIS
jgi:hypothetical protein